MNLGVTVSLRRTDAGLVTILVADDGLSIARELARARGGDSTVTSRVGEGTTFSVTVPRASTAC